MAKTDEQIALDRICEASGYQRWWISSGRLHFERDKAPDRIEVLPIITVAKPEAVASKGVCRQCGHTIVFEQSLPQHYAEGKDKA